MATPIDIPDKLHAQLTDKRHISRINIPGIKSQKRSQVSKFVGSAATKLPSNFPVPLTPEESRACWDQAREEVENSPRAEGDDEDDDKYAVQRRALELIEKLSFQKLHQQEQLEAKQEEIHVAKSRRRVPKKSEPATERRVVRKRPSATPTVKKKKTSANKPARKLPSSKRRSAASMVVPDPVEEEIEESGQEPVADVFLTLNQQTVDTVACDVTENEEAVIVILNDDEEGQEHLLAVRGAGFNVVGQMQITYYDDEDSPVFRNVISRPVRYRHNGFIHMVFVVARDGI